MNIAKNLRKKLGLNQLQMAKNLGISRQAYYYLENQSQSTNLKVLKKLQEISQLELGWSIEKFWKELTKK